MDIWHTINCSDFDVIDWEEFARFRKISQMDAARFLHKTYWVSIKDVLRITAFYNSDKNTISTQSEELLEEMKEALFKVQFDANRVPAWQVEHWYSTHLFTPRILDVDGIWKFIEENNILYKDLNTEKYGHIVSDEDSITLFHEIVSDCEDEKIFVIVDCCYKDKLYYQMNLSDFDNYIIYNGHGTVFNGDCMVLFESGKVFCYFHEHYAFFSNLKFVSTASP
jgi:hypothetical protein